MRSYNKLHLVTILALVVVLIGANLLFYFGQPNEEGKPYMIDINRAYADIVQARNPTAADVNAYSSLEAISFLPESASAEEREAFFSGQSTSVIRTYNTGYLRFDYVDRADEDFTRAWMIANGVMLVVSMLCIGIILYVRQRLVKPFVRISAVPYELSKGHLTSGLKEEKNRYFGRFIWGLDLLRETLEARKQNELNLTRENKVMVLALSHDIKTPLSAIRLYSRALSEDLYESDEKRREVAASINEKAEEIEGLVRDIIKTSREDFLHLEVANGEFYLSDLMAKVQGYYAEKLALIKCDFVVESHRNLLLFGDIERYTEVVENIIENAIKYGDGREIRISFPVEEDHQLIAISNTGNTLPEGELVHIWESFWRGSNSEKQTGSGLGLYICRQLMSAMEGSLYAEICEGRMVVTLIPKEA